jgi:hypothetical protein
MAQKEHHDNDVDASICWRVPLVDFIPFTDKHPKSSVKKIGAATRRGGCVGVRGVAAPFRFAALGARSASRRGLLRSDPGRDLEHWEAGRTAAGAQMGRVGMQRTNLWFAEVG